MFVAGSIRIAKSLGLSPLVIGLTIVAFGTSAPEMGVSISAALSGSPDIALGNILGSNIANIGLILGVAATLGALPVNMRLLRIEVPFLIFLSLATGFMVHQGEISRLAGFGLIIFFVVYCWTLYIYSKKEPYTVQLEFEEALEEDNNIWYDSAIVILGLVGLVAGSKFLVWGATSIASLLEVPELIIGLSLTAIGTSLPELATTIAAVRRKQSDLVLGNVAGSNLANSTIVLGLTAVVSPIPANPDTLYRDIPLMTGLTILLFPAMKIGAEIKRWMGVLFLLTYGGYVILLATSK